MAFTIVDLTADRSDLLDQAARLLHETFRGRTRDWQDVASTREATLESIAEDKISRVALDEAGRVIGWIGAMPDYGGNVWEIHRRRDAGRERPRQARHLRRQGSAIILRTERSMIDSIGPPEVECEQEHAELFVSDISAAVDFYTRRLGFRLAFLAGDPPHMAGVNLGNVQMFLHKGTPNPAGCTVYFVVGNADELYEFQRANGVNVVQEIADREYGLRDYHVRDLHGYVIGFGQHLFNAGPPIEIERVDVPARLEKRLAALLDDLAAYKRMSLSSCLEETLLHALAGVGPHDKATLRHIEKLKEKHGIDYDSHGSYRFVER